MSAVARIGAPSNKALKLTALDQNEAPQLSAVFDGRMTGADDAISLRVLLVSE